MGERKRKGGERVGGGREKKKKMREHNVVYRSLENKN